MKKLLAACIGSIFQLGFLFVQQNKKKKKTPKVKIEAAQDLRKEETKRCETDHTTRQTSVLRTDRYPSLWNPDPRRRANANIYSMFSKLYRIFHTLFPVLCLNFDHYAAAGSLSPAAGGGFFWIVFKRKPSGGDNRGTQWEYLPFITFSNCTPGGVIICFFALSSFALFTSLQTAEPERLRLACSYWDEPPSKVSRESGLWFRGRGAASGVREEDRGVF